MQISSTSNDRAVTPANERIDLAPGQRWVYTPRTLTGGFPTLFLMVYTEPETKKMRSHIFPFKKLCGKLECAGHSSVECLGKVQLKKSLRRNGKEYLLKARFTIAA